MLENMTKRVAYSALHLDLLVITLTVVIRENEKKKRFYLSASTVQGVSAKCLLQKQKARFKYPAFTFKVFTFRIHLPCLHDAAPSSFILFLKMKYNFQSHCLTHWRRSSQWHKWSDLHFQEAIQV